MFELKLLSIPFILLSLLTVGCDRSINARSGIEETNTYETSQADINSEEAVENPGDELDADMVDEQP